MLHKQGRYHHGSLAESLLDAVEELAERFGLEAVTLRGCAKLIGVAPSAAFKHYRDKRALFTAFATKALHLMAAAMEEAGRNSQSQHPFLDVGLAYLAFGLKRRAMFQAMWRSELIDAQNPDYRQASQRLGALLSAGFAESLADDDRRALSAQELLAWSSVHGLASLYVEGALGAGLDREAKLAQARLTLAALGPSLAAGSHQRSELDL